MLTDHEQFRLGFLARCAEARLTAGEIRTVTAWAKQAVAGGGSLLKLWATLPLTAAGYALGGSAIAGGLVGHAMAKAQDPEDTAEQVKRQELIEKLRQQAARARRNVERLNGAASPVFPRLA